jgi:hemoglobin
MQRADTTREASLYGRLGGAWKIAVIVDDFIERIMADPRLEANPRVKEANQHLTKPGLKYFVTELTCWATGGPQTYTGRSMGESHRHLMITESEWDSFLDDLRQSLDAHRVAEAEQRELIELFNRSKAAIVQPVSGRA